MQGELALLSTMQGPAKPPRPKVLRQVKTVAQAIDVSIRDCGFKAGYIAASLGISDAYVSRLRRGKRKIPSGLQGRVFVDDFCRVTGSLLLVEVLKKLQDENEAMEPWQENARLANELRQVAA